MNNNGGIYTIINSQNGKQYIGSAINLRARLWSHQNKLGNRTHHNPHLQASFDKYGKDAFEFRVLLYCEQYELLRYEQALIDRLQPEYNMCLVAGNRLGTKHTKEFRQRRSETYKNNPQIVERIRNLALARKGKKLPRETVTKMIIAHKGKSLSKETKSKISQAHKGKIISDEHRLNLSLSHKRIKQSDESRHKKSEKLKGVPRGPYSKERCQKNSEAHKGIKLPPRTKEHCRRLSEAKKKWWAERLKREVA